MHKKSYYKGKKSHTWSENKERLTKKMFSQFLYQKTKGLCNYVNESLQVLNEFVAPGADLCVLDSIHDSTCMSVCAHD